MHAFLSRMTNKSKQKSRRVLDAEACFTSAELERIRQQFQQAVQAQGSASTDILQEHAFLYALCSWPLPPSTPQGLTHGHTSPAGPPQSSATPSYQQLGRALFRACSGCAAGGDVPGAKARAGSTSEWAWGGREGGAVGSKDPQGVTLDDVIVAKAACERMSVSDNTAFAFELCARMGGPDATPASTSPAPSTTIKSTEPVDSLSPDCLARCISAACGLSTALGNLPPPPEVDSGSRGAGVAASAPAEVQHHQQQPLLQLPCPQAAPLGGPAGAGDAAGMQQPQQQQQQQPAQQQQPQQQQSPGADDQWVSAVVLGALWIAAGPAASKPAPSVDLTGYTRWARACLAFHTLLTHLLSAVGAQAPGIPPADTVSSGRPDKAPPSGNKKVAQHPSGPGETPSRVQQALSTSLPHCPELVMIGPTGEVSGPAPLQGLMLRPLPAMLLSHSMPPAHRKEWRLLFNSHRDGKSFNTLMGKLAAVEGATLLLVREAGEEGHLVAGYAPMAWRKSGAFFGDHSTWVARLWPDMQVFSSTGANTNFQWCGQGFSQLVNGIGFGGAQGAHSAFGLLVDATLDTGHSRPIATFGCPSLTHDQVFKVDSVECWLVQPPEPEDGEGSGHGTASVLDKAGADRLIMDLAGRNVNHSAGLRQAEPIFE